MPKCARGSHLTQNFFASGKATRSLPGEDDSDDERQALEDRHTGKIATALRAIMRKVAPPGTTVNNITPDIAVSRYREASNLLRDALVAMLTDGVLLGAQVGGQQVEYILGVRKATILGVDWDLINQDALAWVLSNPSQLGQGFGNGYANAVVSAMNTTSEQQLTTQVGEWIRNGLTYRSLIDQMERTVFSRQRAEMVATTEITRSFAAGNQAAWRRSGIIKEMRWRTANDERTCPVCSALNGTVVSIEGDFSNALPEDQGRVRGSFMLPPAHVRCRCIILPVVRVGSSTQPAAPDPDRFTFSGDIELLNTARFTQDDISRLFDIGDSAKARIVIRGDSNEIEIIGTWTDAKTGEYIGECIRNLYPNQKQAYLSALAFESQYIGNGTGMRVARSWFDALYGAGYEKAELYAGLTIGRYAWAKEGAEYDDRGAAAQATAKFRTWALARGITDLTENEYPTFTRPLDVATWQHPRGRTLTGKDTSNQDVPRDMTLPLGKAFMLDMNIDGHGGWNGIIDLAARKNKSAKSTMPVDAKATGPRRVYINGYDDSQSDALFWDAYLVDDDTDVKPLTV